MGDWSGIRTKDNPDPIEGLSFYADHSFENKLGFFKKVADNRIFLGTKSKFRLIKGNLMLSYPGVKTWEKAKILILTPHNLKISLKWVVFNFVRTPYVHPSTLKFDKIIVSSSGCYGSCPVANTIINADGSVIFQGVGYTTKHGLFTGSISPVKFREIQSNFGRIDLNALGENYKGSASDQETISITFIKNGKIYKTISDYGGAAPYLFKSAYIKLAYLYQSISLKAIFYPPYLQEADLRPRQRSMILDIKQSELFLLQENIRTGKIVHAGLARPFKIRVYKDDHENFDDAYADGRYFLFIVKGKPVIIDIGYNFYTAYNRKWAWKKQSPYN